MKKINYRSRYERRFSRRIHAQEQRRVRRARRAAKVFGMS